MPTSHLQPDALLAAPIHSVAAMSNVEPERTHPLAMHQRFAGPDGRVMVLARFPAAGSNAQEAGVYGSELEPDRANGSRACCGESSARSPTPGPPCGAA